MSQPRMSLARGSWRRRPLLALIVLILLLVVGYTAQGLHHGHRADHPNSALGSTSAQQPVPLSSLPVQARQTVNLIQHHGPYPYRQDGVVYQNLERQLPPERTGYYHEYTVPTPGSADRGARRIVTGSAGQFYYTANHYATFVQVNLSG